MHHPRVEWLSLAASKGISMRTARIMSALSESAVTRVSASLPFPWTVDDVCMWSRGDLMRLPGLGAGVADDIEAWLAREGRALRKS